jgi:hypothetical protein
MNLVTVKQISLLSAFLGALLGIAALIPFLGKPAFIALICFASVFVLIFLLKFGLIERLSTKDSVIAGALVGFISFIGFCAVYLPAVALLGNAFDLYAFEGITFALRAGTPAVIIMLVLFVSVLAATINAFSGFLTFYVIEFLGDKS